MSHAFLKMASIPLLALLIVIFAISYNLITNQSGANRLVTRTFWNLNAGFADSELTFLDGAHYTNGGIGAVSVEGSYALTQDRITFVEYGPADAPCLHIPGTWQWKLNRTTLTLKEIDDKCSTRQYDWGSGFWTEQPEARQFEEELVVH
jgi:hypothetical protein